ncbi:aldo/keto reductase [Aliagarivorans taiwanensis]|uniref:aldo/keto reductase n=1 Tax=Aliagarivorans taiwanensis TaxID=561966 RepID=UPI00042142FB|nr:aldo/keto reductase [Aliagarivorans taiwanensis]
MQYSKLGSSELSVSRVCLGSMTWGKQNNQQDADQQIDYALSEGVNFIDTAEMYAVPPSAETYGKTEEIIGNYLAANPERRKDIVLATKIAGAGLPWVRDAGPITGEAVIASVDASLKRLQTDYIDLYQLHWPNRTTPHFGKHHPGHFRLSDSDAAQQTEGMLDILQGLQECVKAGKIRFCGLSDDTPWGIEQYLRLSEQHSLPRMVSIQNEFSLLHAKDWPYLIETCIHQDVAYLPWSPLAGGVLSGKYLGGARPEGSRWSIAQRNGLFRDTPEVEAAVREYQNIAQQHGMTAAQLALAWCDKVDGVCSTIIGATSMSQLKEDMDAFKLELNVDAQEAIAAVFKRYPAPF